MEHERDDLRLENRLTKLEQAVLVLDGTLRANTEATHVTAGEVREGFRQQNGRIGKLEDFRVQVFAVIALFSFAAPFVFFALNQVLGG